MAMGMRNTRVPIQLPSALPSVSKVWAKQNAPRCIRGFRKCPRKPENRLLTNSRTADVRCLSATEAVSQVSENKQLFIFGFGYTALGLANSLRKKGWTVKGTCRNSEKQRELQSMGYDTFLFDTDHLSLGLGKKGIAALREATHVLVTISPSSPEESCPVMWLLGQNFKAVAERLQWIGYLSSTSVYGGHNGEWVDERSELRADIGNGLSRRQSEESWLRFGAATGLPVHLFRLAGIYGPGRSALDVTYKGGKRAGKHYTSRCHVADICQVLEASMGRPQAGEAYNVADDDPSSREVVLEHVRTHFRAGERSGGDTLTLPKAPPAERLVMEKRVSNRKVKEQLGVQFLFPSYREGLAAIHGGNHSPFA